jgi:oxygen-independent coproporphyrinogen-3 oxidase
MEPDHGPAAVTLDLLRRYDRPGPRYTSYPTAVEFTSEFNEQDYRARLSEVNRQVDEPLSLYVHLPFCEERCHYCGCNVVITRRREVAARYLSYLHREIDLLAAHLPRRRELAQCHWGGGTPTYLTIEQMAQLHRRIRRHFHLPADAEQAIEIDPRVTSQVQLAQLRRMGFNRISIGVQDFNPEVQAAVNRHQTEAETRQLFAWCRALAFGSINLDLIYGLPLQTVERYRRNIETVLDLRPDRLAVYSYAHVPWMKAHQKRINADDLPGPEDKLKLFSLTREMLLAGGYVQIGMDHFALPGDELVAAMGERRLHRNFMGYTVKGASDMVGVGISAIGDVRGSYAQNYRKLSDYYQALDAAEFPIERGYLLHRDDRVRRDVITRLMCNFHVDMATVEQSSGIHFRRYFADELERLAAPDGPVSHGLLEIHSDRIVVVDRGRLFVRNIAMFFDAYRKTQTPQRPMFSSTV